MDYQRKQLSLRRATDFDETLFESLRDPKEAGALFKRALEYSGRIGEAFSKALRKGYGSRHGRLAAKTNLSRRAMKRRFRHPVIRDFLH